MFIRVSSLAMIFSLQVTNVYGGNSISSYVCVFEVKYYDYVFFDVPVYTGEHIVFYAPGSKDRGYYCYWPVCLSLCHCMCVSQNFNLG